MGTGIKWNRRCDINVYVHLNDNIPTNNEKLETKKKNVKLLVLNIKKLIKFALSLSKFIFTHIDTISLWLVRTLRFTLHQLRIRV